MRLAFPEGAGIGIFTYFRKCHNNKIVSLLQVLLVFLLYNKTTVIMASGRYNINTNLTLIINPRMADFDDCFSLMTYELLLFSKF